MLLVIIVIGLTGGVALLLVSTLQRRNEERAVGVLSRESRRADRRAGAHPGEALGGRSGTEVEEASRLARRGGEQVVVAPDAPVAPWTPPDPEQLGVDRRQFLNRSILGGFALGLAGFGGATLAYLWPKPSVGFGSKISVGKISDIDAAIQAGTGFAYYPDGRMWITNYPASALDKARKTYSPAELNGMEAGVVALYQKCVHLGCRVPACLTSQWFECPCHGSQYNQVGEKKAGPAPRGLDRFPMEVSNGVLAVDTSTIILGPPIGTDTTGQEPEGPHCISGAHE